MGMEKEKEKEKKEKKKRCRDSSVRKKPHSSQR
jgi:hypothetical protein